MAHDKMKLQDWLDDLCVRFIINLPREDLSSVARICFQIEEAQWFYEDFIRPLDPSLPSMTLRTFTLKMFQHCPLLASFSTDVHLLAFEEFMTYKTRVPVRGAIMLNDAMDAAVLVRGYKKGSSWSFPRGKINKNEDDLVCASREVYEETGFDLRASGLVERNQPVQPLEITMHDQQVRLYVFRGIPEDTVFETRTRKEIGDIKWYSLADLPTYKKKKGVSKNQASAPTSHDKFYMVAPFMGQLKQWILKQQKLDAENAARAGHQQPPVFFEDLVTDDNMPPEQFPHASSRNFPDNIDKATKELHQLLRINPPTHGLQLQPPVSNQEPGQTLLSILKPKTVDASFAPEHGHSQPALHREREFAGMAQPSILSHRLQSQGISPAGYAEPPQYPGGPRSGPEPSYHSQYPEHRPRPQVFVTDDLPQPNHLRKPHELPKPPVQLQHPQPLPPQVQKKMLLHNLHDMVSPPSGTGVANQHVHPNVPQGFDAAPGPNAHYSQYRPHGGDIQANQIPPLGQQSANLLTVLTGKNPATTIHQSPLQPSSSVATRIDGHYGAASMPSTTYPSATMQAPVSSSRGITRPDLPTDQHRASLLGMFKAGQSMMPQNQVAGQSASLSPVVSRTTQLDSQRQQGMRHGASGSDASRSTVRANGQSTLNAEFNGSYGAQTILRRDSNQGSSHSPAMSTRNSNELTTHLPVRSHHSPGSSRDQMSAQSQLSPYQKYLHAQAPSPNSAAPPVPAHTAPSFSYGGSQAAGDQSHLVGGPTASTLPLPGMLKPKQGASVEQKKALLSIFGKPQLEGEHGKGKGIAGPEQTAGSDSMPRARLASFASQSTSSRRSSAAPLSSADRNFLLDFLSNASSNAKV